MIGNRLCVVVQDVFNPDTAGKVQDSAAAGH